jgi:hypothetical protein
MTAKTTTQSAAATVGADDHRPARLFDSPIMAADPINAAANVLDFGQVTTAPIRIIMYKPIITMFDRRPTNPKRIAIPTADA